MSPVNGAAPPTLGEDDDRLRPRPIKRIAALLDMRRALITIGLVLVMIGLLWPVIQRLGLGHLPGDIVIERENFRFYFPITTLIVVSIVISLILWFLRK